MKKLAFLILISLGSVNVFAQTPSAETEAVKKVINQLFEGMRKGDSSMVHKSFAPGMILQTISSREGKIQVRSEAPEDFLKAVGTPHNEMWDERISFDQVLIDANLASVWTSYKFYTGEKFSHCGVNSFQLVKGSNGWQIVYLIDTRRKEKCN